MGLVNSHVLERTVSMPSGVWWWTGECNGSPTHFIIVIQYSVHDPGAMDAVVVQLVYRALPARRQIIIEYFQLTRQGFVGAALMDGGMTGCLVEWWLN